MKLVFTDGMSFDLSGPLRIVREVDGLFLVGGNMLVPVADEAEAEMLIASVERAHVERQH
jgi:hypothetical protein